MNSAPLELRQLWRYTRQAELYVAIDYGQRGVRLLSPAGCAEFTREGVTVAPPLDRRVDWPIAANGITQFLDAIEMPTGSWFWDPAAGQLAR